MVATAWSRPFPGPQPHLALLGLDMPLGQMGHLQLLGPRLGWGGAAALGTQALVALSAGSASDPRAAVDSLTLGPPSGCYRQSWGAGERCKYRGRYGGGWFRGSA